MLHGSWISEHIPTPLSKTERGASWVWEGEENKVNSLMALANEVTS